MLTPPATTLPVIATLTASVLIAAAALAWYRPRSIVDHPLLVLAVPLLLSLLSMAALIDPAGPSLRMRLDPSEEPMLAPDDPGLAPYHRATANFGDDNVYVVAVETAEVFNTEFLLAMQTASNRLRRLKGVRNVDSLVTTTHYGYDDDIDTVLVRRLIDRVPEDPGAMAALRERALSDRVYPRSIVSADGRTAALNISFVSMSDGDFVLSGLDESIRAIAIEEFPAPANVYVTGRQHVKTRAHHIMVGDLSWLIPLAMTVGAFVGWLVTGSLRAGFIPVGASVLATLWVFASLAALGRPLNMITLVLGPVLICVGAVYGIHILARYEALVDEGMNARDAALGSLKDTVAPTLMAGATTVAGFASLAGSDIPATQELGLLAATGVAWATVSSLCSIPALLSLLPPRGSRRQTSVGLRATALLRRLLGLTAGFCTRRPLPILAAWALVAVVSAGLLPRIVVDTDYLTFFDPSSKVRTDFAAVGRLLTGASPVYVALHGGQEGAFREPGTLRALERLQAEVDRVPGVKATTTIVDFIAPLNRAMEQGEPSAERVPDSKAGVAELMFMLPRNRVRGLVNSNHSSANLLVRSSATGSAAVRQLEDDLNAAITRAGLPAGIEANVTGNTIVLNHGADSLARTQTTIVAFAALAIFVLMSRFFRSAGAGLLAMIPNLVPVLVFFGLLGAGVAMLSLATSLLGCIALGMAVDDTAHFLVGYKRRRERGMQAEAAVSDCIATLGKPIVVTSIMLSSGFLVLLLSGFAAFRQLGALAATTMMICLFADLTLLPALLLRFRR
jgi:predicted RND superfamily exporter protein